MIKRAIFSAAAALLLLPTQLLAWQPQGDKISTRWGKEISPESAWRSYPRPQLQRQEWQNLNGLWSYAITGQDTKRQSVKYEGEILVPYAVESSLSGVQRQFLPTDMLWYKRSFNLDKSWAGKDIILHFGAVDYACTLWINGQQVGSHKGGNNPFEFNITKYLKRSGEQCIELSVTDPTDSESVTQGKQRIDAKSIFYTAVSGIWQTVWLEAVSRSHIEQVVSYTNIDDMSVELDISLSGASGNEELNVEVYDGDKLLKSVSGRADSKIKIDMQGATLWSPSTPKLYDIKLELKSRGKVVDSAKSYFTMRQVSQRCDEHGYNRIYLNNEPIFQYGTLDQGWWPESLLTPPTEQALLWDMVQLKELGFNTIRKHIKVEPEIFYYYADSLGLMVWQDMVSGFVKGKGNVRPDAADWDAPTSHSEQWEMELFDMIERLRFYSSITTWVIFNEGWGQYNTEQITHRVMKCDPSRLINGVSGWQDRGVGQFYDIHNYPYASMILPEYNGARISALGEFGGFGWAIPDHLWNPDMNNWGYKNIDGAIDLMENYANVLYDLESLIAQGLAAAIYTQTSDIEGEVNGLITYDREIVKLPKVLTHTLHSRLYRTPSAAAVSLVEDAQGGKSHERRVAIGGGEFALKSLPFEITEPEDVISEVEFNSKEAYDNLSLWISATGEVRVVLNGVEIMNDTLTQQRHYNQFNLSDYASYLKKGRNILRIEAKGCAKVNFDYGLRAF